MSLQQPFEPVFKPQAETSLPLVVSDLSTTPLFGFSLEFWAAISAFFEASSGSEHGTTLPRPGWMHASPPRCRGGLCAPFALAPWCPEIPVCLSRCW